MGFFVLLEDLVGVVAVPNFSLVGLVVVVAPVANVPSVFFRLRRQNGRQGGRFSFLEC